VSGRAEIEFEWLWHSPSAGESDDLPRRVLAGDVIVARRALGALGVLEPFEELSYEGISQEMGEEAALEVRRRGFERFHEVVSAPQVPEVTERAYRLYSDRAPALLETMAREILGIEGRFYFERNANVRFHVPYDLARAHRRAYTDFARDRGEGKISAHGPHRDSWLDCPDNAVNLWAAIGPVQHGNGLSVFPEAYRWRLSFVPGGGVPRGQALGVPITCELAPGDVLLFHSDHVHASELNRCEATRHVVSFRVCVDRPHFPNGHYHHYRHSSLGGLPQPLREMPANLAGSWLDTQVRFLGKRLGLQVPARCSSEEAVTAESLREEDPPVLVEEPPAPGELVLLSERLCATTRDDGTTVAFDRFCPHEGADLSRGHVRDGVLYCPWHNLAFDLETGRSPCTTLGALELRACRRNGDGWEVDEASERVAAESEASAREA
jgi:nitrite reductase/ring-hydroxylating ferredoxin subunit